MGWFGMELAKELQNDFIILGSKRNVLQKNPGNFDVIAFNLYDENQDKVLNNLLESDIVLFNIPPGSGESKTLFLKQSKALIAKASEANVSQFILISSTGVFANDQNSVNEDTYPLPASENGRVLAELESHLINISFPYKHIIRPGGLIGGKRHPIFYLAGKDQVSGKNHPVNLVHRHDLVGITKTVLNLKPKESFIHAVCPEHPAKSEYYQKSAEYFNLVPPSFGGDQSQGKTVISARSSEILGYSYKFKSPYDMLSSINRS